MNGVAASVTSVLLSFQLAINFPLGRIYVHFESYFYSFPVFFDVLSMSFYWPPLPTAADSRVTRITATKDSKPQVTLNSCSYYMYYSSFYWCHHVLKSLSFQDMSMLFIAIFLPDCVVVIVCCSYVTIGNCFRHDLIKNFIVNTIRGIENQAPLSIWNKCVKR